jgi:hypothetical protein
MISSPFICKQQKGGEYYRIKKRRDKYEKDEPTAKKLRSEVEKSVADVEKNEKTAEEETVECRVCMKSVKASNCPKVTESCKHENLVCGDCMMKSCEADLNSKGELKVFG